MKKIISVFTALLLALSLCLAAASAEPLMGGWSVCESTDITPEARAALEECGFSCKTAIVMLLLGLDAEEAERTLAAADGRIARAISPET